MGEWALSGLSCLSKPAAVAFHPIRAPRTRFDWQRTDIFVQASGDELWHTAHISRGAGIPPETWCIPCTAAPVALALQEESEARRSAILDALVIDAEKNLWHKRLQPPITVPYLREASGCLPLLSILGTRFWCRLYKYFGWTPLGGPWDSNPGGASYGTGQLTVAVRARDGSVSVRRYDGPNQNWSSWHAIQGNEWIGDPVVATGSIGATAIFTVSRSGTLQLTVFDEGWNLTTTDLGNDLIGPPAVLTWANQAMLFGLAANNNLQFRSFTAHVGWTPWEPVGLEPQRQWSTSPVALLWQTGLSDLSLRQFVFARDMQNELWFTCRLYDGLGSPARWIQWQTLGGDHTADFTVVPRGVNQLAVYAKGRTTQDLYATVLNDIG